MRINVSILSWAAFLRLGQPQLPDFSQSERLPLTINVRSMFYRKTGKATFANSAQPQNNERTASGER